MFDKLNAMKQQMEDLKTQMDNLSVSESVQDGAVVVSANGNGRVTAIELNPQWLKSCEAEEAEELILLAVNRAVEKASSAHAAEMQKMAGGLLPGMF
ncbi:MAG: YbaB/EbfC family nucleoid-associated protein [Bacteroidia bacterium]